MTLIQHYLLFRHSLAQEAKDHYMIKLLDKQNESWQFVFTGFNKTTGSRTVITKLGNGKIVRESC